MPRINELKFKRASDKIALPRKGSEKSAGFDVALPHDVVLRPGARVFLDLGIAFDIPEGFYMEVVPRSSNGDKKGSDGLPSFVNVLSLTNTIGIIDEDYTGTVKAKLQNTGSGTYLGYSGDYVLQCILKEYTQIDKFTEVDEITKQTKRGDKGFGSSDE